RILGDEVRSKRIRMTLRLEAPHQVIHGDPARLHQIFWNILRNAVKFTPVGGEVGIHATGDRRTLRIEISDSGIGIDPSVLPRIFNPFEQGDPLTSRAAGGLGLGLSICRALTELHGGTIRAHSDGPSRGSTFVVSL